MIRGPLKCQSVKRQDRISPRTSSKGKNSFTTSKRWQCRLAPKRAVHRGAACNNLNLSLTLSRRIAPAVSPAAAAADTNASCWCRISVRGVSLSCVTRISGSTFLITIQGGSAPSRASAVPRYSRRQPEFLVLEWRSSVIRATEDRYAQALPGRQA